MVLVNLDHSCYNLQANIATVHQMNEGGNLSFFLLVLPSFLPSAILFFYTKLDPSLLNKLFNHIGCLVSVK